MTHSRSLSSAQLFILLFVSLCALFAASALGAWTGPTQTAPNGNVAAPVNVGTTDQVKNAGLSVNALTVFGSAYVQNNLGVGRVSPVVALDVNGTERLGNGGETCQAITEGAIRYNSSSKKIEYCNGSSWSAIDTVNATGLASCRVCWSDSMDDSCTAYSSGNVKQSATMIYTQSGAAGPSVLSIQCQ